MERVEHRYRLTQHRDRLRGAIVGREVRRGVVRVQVPGGRFAGQLIVARTVVEPQIALGVAQECQRVEVGSGVQISGEVVRFLPRRHVDLGVLIQVVEHESRAAARHAGDHEIGRPACSILA